MNFKISAWAAIASAIIMIPSFILGILLGIMPENQVIYTFSIIAMVISILISIPLLLGYINIARIYKLKKLEIIMYLVMIIGVVFSIYTIFTIKEDFTLISFVFMFSIGVIGITGGIILLKLNKVFGGIITAISILHIINGFFFISIILVLFLPLTVIALNILESIFFFRISKELK